MLRLACGAGSEDRIGKILAAPYSDWQHMSNQYTDRLTECQMPLPSSHQISLRSDHRLQLKPVCRVCRQNEVDSVIKTRGFPLGIVAILTASKKRKLVTKRFVAEAANAAVRCRQDKVRMCSGLPAWLQVSYAGLGGSKRSHTVQRELAVLRFHICR